MDIPQPEVDSVPPNSAFAEVLGTGYIPSVNDITAIKDHLQQPRERLDSIDAHVKRLQDELAALSVQRDAVQRYIQAHEAIISFPRRLPTDILAEIFWCCLPKTHDAICSQSQAPLLLTRICKRWREVALSTPRLWSSIHIVILLRYPSPRIDDKFDDLIRNKCAGIRAWLKRSGQCPLNITMVADARNAMSLPPLPPLALPSTEPQLDLQVEYQMFSDILQYAQRWKTIKLDLSARVMTLLARLKGEELPLLESLKVGGAFGSEWDMQPLNCTLPFIRDSPRLSKLSLCNFTSMVPLPHQQIRHLTIQCRSNNSYKQHLLTMLSQCRDSLESFTLISYESEGSEASSPPCPCKLPKLRALTIVGSLAVGGLCDHVCRGLIVPALVKLSCQNSVRQGDRRSFLPMLERSGCTLKTLHYSNYFVADYMNDELPKILAYSPQLKRLHITCAVHDPARTSSHFILTALTHIPDATSNPVLCPKLKDIRFERCCFSKTALFAMVRSRINDEMDPGVARLKSVHAAFNYRPQPGDDKSEGLQANWEALRMTGLKITLEYPEFIPNPFHELRSDPWLGISFEERPWYAY